MGKLHVNQKGFSAVESLLVLVIVGMVGFVGWYVWHAKQSTDKSLAANNSTTPAIKKKSVASTPTSADPYAGWQVFKDTLAGYSIKYPSDWTVNVTPNTLLGAGTETVTISSQASISDKSANEQNSAFGLAIDSFNSSSKYGAQFPNKSTQECYKQNDTIGGVETLKVANYGTLYVVDHQDTQIQPNFYATSVCTNSNDTSSFIASPTISGAYSSIMGSGQAGSGTTYAQFSSTPEVIIAKKILQSLTY